MSPTGILLVDKPDGMTSHDVVSRARRSLNTRKVGHAGTLDPMATGLLLLGVGSSTRLLTYLVGLGKRYAATIRLGVSTDTDDADGGVTATADAGGVSRQRIDAGVAALSGTAFGKYGEGYMRFSYANSVENIQLALDAVRANLA